MRLARLTLAFAAFMGLAAFDDPAGKYVIDFPEGWTTTPASAEGFTFAHAPDKVTNCGAKAAAVPAFAAYTQDEINAQLFANPFGAADWASVLGADAGLITLEAGEIIEANGLKVQIATLKLGAGFESIPFETLSRIVVSATPGIVYIGACIVETAKYDDFKDIFETTVRSLRPL
ncbi:MAG: hypothetical protein QM698_10560 [Micropepsaceae bacterium]